MPTLPATDGLPVWAQVLISVLVCIATLAVAFKGYFGNKPAPAAATETTQVSLAALLTENGAIRHNSDALVQLSVNVLALTNCINEATHHERVNTDLLREMCDALESLKVEIERQGRESRGWDKRDEGRRDSGRRID